MNIARAFIMGALLTVLSMPLLAAPSLCTSYEDVIFSCKTKRKTYEICTSKNLSAASGYMQYRAGTNGKVEFVFPSKHLPPAGYFKFQIINRYSRLTFQNGEFSYEITEPLIGKTGIGVSKGNKGVAQIECQNFTDSLTRTNTQNLFRSLGISED